MLRACTDAVADTAFDRPGAAAVVQEGDVLLPGQPDHHEQTLALRRVEEVLGRHGVRADGVDAAGGHRREVRRDLALRGVVAVGPRRERPVGDALEVELLVTAEEELALDPRSAG